MLLPWAWALQSGMSSYLEAVWYGWEDLALYLLDHGARSDIVSMVRTFAHHGRRSVC